MTAIPIYVSGPREVVQSAVEQSAAEGGVEVVSTRPLESADRMRFGVAEAVVVVGLVKGTLELSKLAIEIVKLLRDLGKGNAVVSLDTADGRGASLRADSSPADVEAALTALVPEAPRAARAAPAAPATPPSDVPDVTAH
jgi:hypothetical protein